MARKVRAGDAKLMSRTARETLRPNRKPYYRLIERGIALGYRKPSKGPGTWLVRRYIGNDSYTVINLVTADGRPIFADDHEDANGKTVLNFGQAQDAIRVHKNEPAKNTGSYTVAQAAQDYLDFLVSEGRADAAVRDAKTRIDAFILPTLGGLKVEALKPDQLRRWRTDLAKAPPRLRTRSDEKQKYRDGSNERARRATANRILTTLKALLNHAFDEEMVSSNKAWGRRVKPFEGADVARVRHLTIEEAARLVNACDPEFRPLVQAALQTGARYGQITGLKVSDFHPDVGTINFRTRKGTGEEKSSVCVLTDEGVSFFKHACAGRKDSELIFRKDNGREWLRSHQFRPMVAACKRAKIKHIGFHGLRHTWASLSVMSGVPLMVVAKNLGHSDTRMVERHYGHLAPSFVADAIRAGAPRFGFEPSNITPMRGGR
jgi:integrase